MAKVKGMNGVCYLTINGTVVAATTAENFRDDFKKAMLRATSLNSAGEEREAGLEDVTITMSMYFDANDAGQAAAEAAAEAGTIVTVVRVVGSSTKTRKMLIESMSTSVPVGDFVKRDITFQRAQD